MQVKNVIIISDAATVNGGAVKVAIQSAIGLSKLGLKVLFFSAVGPICEELQNSTVEVICLNQKDILSEKSRIKAIIQGVWNRCSYVTLDKVLQQYKEDDTVIHSHVLIKALSPSVWSVLSKYRFKVFVTLHDYFLFCPNGGMYNYCKQQICKTKASSLSCYITNCDSRNYGHKLWRDLRQVVQKRAFKKIENLNFISISSLNKKIAYPYLKKYAKAWYEVQNPIYFHVLKPVDIKQNEYYLFIGRLSPEKGIDMFCKAISDLGLKGLVLGDGDQKEEYQKKYPMIEFVGWVTGERKDEYINKGKALVFPSKWYEGAPLTILEMKAFGIPCIVPDLCAASEEVEDGKTGLVFETGNVHSLKESLRRYEEEDILAMQNRILSNFSPSVCSIENHCRKLIDCYNQ